MPGQGNDGCACRWAAAACFICVFYANFSASAQQAVPPLHERIDRAVAGAHVGPVAATADDAAFLRRIHLDLTGMIPSAAQTRAFLADQTSDKRAQLIDHLLDSPAYVRHMTAAFDLMLMERRGDKHVTAADWQQYLRTSIEQNKPYNQLVAEILAADGSDPAARAPAKFFLEREAEPNLLTREVGRMFFGADLECAQCHDHPLIDDYLQSDYYGLFAFVGRTHLFQPDPKQPALLAEKAEGDVKFKSVFTGVEGETGPRLPGGSEIDEPTFNKGEEYQVAPDPKDKNVRPIPKHSRRAELARRATDGSNRAFNRNIVNRLWAHMIGRGLVHPVDLHHAANPPAHPGLLEALADEFAATNFDVKAILRELALSQTYQRSFKMPDSVDEQIAAARAELPAAEAEVTQRQDAVAAAKQAADKHRAVRAAAKPAVEAAAAELAKANAALSTAQQAAADAAKAQTDAEQMLAAKQQIATPLSEAVEKIQAALKGVPDDKELAAAAEKFVAKSKQADDEVAALTNTVAERTAATAAARQQVTAAEQVAAAQAASVDAANKQLAGLNAQLETADAVVAAAVREVQSARHRLQHAQLLTAYGDAQAALAATNAAVAKTTADLAAAQIALDQANAVLAKLQAELPAVQKIDAEATAALATANAEVAARREIAQLVGDSQAKAEAAAGKLPGDADLTVAIEKLKGRSEQLKAEAAELQKTADARQTEQKGAADKLAALTTSIATAATAAADMKKQADEFEAQLQQTTAKATADEALVASAYDAVTKQWSAHFAVTPLEALSPEQLAWSILQATGQYDRQLAASAAEINQKTPLTEADQQDAAKVAARQAEIEADAVAKLQPNVGTFVNLYGAGAGQPQHEFYATVDQALFVANGGNVLGWLSPGGGNLTDRLLKAEDPQALAEELYLSVLTRLPSETEAADVAAYLESKADKKNEAVQELAWALLTSTEFRFNH